MCIRDSYTATLRNAQLAGIGDVTGSIAPGKSADFIVTRENPLEDLRALQHLELVAVSYTHLGAAGRCDHRAHRGRHCGL